MKITGIIAEYNPFHQGHIYHIQKAKKITQCDCLVVILTGCFSQRGLPSLLTPYDKTKLALQYGANLVLECPVCFGAQSADYFAKYNLQALSCLPIDTLCFGSETNDVTYLRRLLHNQKERQITEKMQKVTDKLSSLENKEKKLQEQIDNQIVVLEGVAKMSQQDARKELFSVVEKKMEHETIAYIKDKEEEAKATAQQKAQNIIALAIERMSQQETQERTVSVVSIPGEEMKGRIIGREGRNIRAFEQATGVELNIDDTPDLITITCFNPVRREVARLALEHLIRDGRIQPGRIEEVVKKYQQEIDQEIMNAGEDAIFKLGIGKIDREIVKLIGTMKYRYSYGQNALQHSIEVAYLAGAMAAELGLNQQMAKRAGLLHDIGKALNIEQQDGSHVELGYKFCKKHGEKEIVLNAILSHHGDVEPKFLTSHLVIAADTISAARPGARKESAQAYIDRLENLEKIATSYEGVQNAFAIQAGREIRVMVNPESVDDLTCVKLAREIRDQIESELTYPGQIKVNVIREIRAQELAK